MCVFHLISKIVTGEKYLHTTHDCLQLSTTAYNFLQLPATTCGCCICVLFVLFLTLAFSLLKFIVCNCKFVICSTQRRPKQSWRQTSTTRLLILCSEPHTNIHSALCVHNVSIYCTYVYMSREKGENLGQVTNVFISGLIV